MAFCGEDKTMPLFMTHYVTNVDTFKLFSPVYDIHNDNGESVTLYKRR